jgi:potassium-dependent mechanosensitive channel
MNPARVSQLFSLFQLGLAQVLLCSVITCATVPGAIAAETKSPPAQPDLPVALADTIDSALSALPRRTDLDAAQRKQAEELLHDALNDDQRASEETSQWQAFHEAAEKAKADATRAAADHTPALPQDLSAAFDNWRTKLPQDASNEQLSDLLEQERNLLATAQDALRGLEDSLQQQTQRPDALRDELVAARALDDSVTAPPPAGTPQTLAAAIQLRQQAAARLQRCRLAALELEQRSYDARVRVLFAQRSERRRDVEEHSQRVHLLENMLLAQVNSANSDLVDSIATARDKLVAAKAEPVVVETANTNLDLGHDLIDTVKRIATLRDLRNTYGTQRTQSELAVKNTQARIELGGVSEEVGSLLLAERRKLSSLSVLKRSLADLRNELAQTKLNLMDLREQQDALENPDAVIANLLTRAGQLPVISGALYDALQHLLGARSDLLTRLISTKTRQVLLLSDTEQQLSGLATSTVALSNLLDSHLLGTPSHVAITLPWFIDLGHALRAIVTPASEKQALGMFDNLRHASVSLLTLALLMLIAAVFARRRVPRIFAAIALPMRRIRTDRYRFTLQVLALTLFAAAPIALLWALLGHILLHTSTVDPLEGSLGLATNSVAVPWFVLAFVYWLNRENGLAHQHFRWPRVRRTALRRAVPWLALVILLPMFCHLWLKEIASDQIDATIGRALFILGSLGMALIAWQLLQPGSVWAQRGGVVNEPIRARQVARIGLSGIFVAIAVLSAIGYFFTAVTIAEHMLESLIAVLVVSIVHGMAVRWLVLGERRLALKRMEDKQSAAAQSKDDRAGAEVLPEVEDEEVTISDLGAQTRRVLRLAILILLGAILLLIWKDIAPALSFLDKIAVWKSTYADTDGKQVAFDVTLNSMLESFLVLAMTWVATRNLPGLLEIGVLRRLSIDAPTRYAITSIVRYLIVLVGTLVGIGLLGVRWSNLQWLAAGLTVGLGFGLQEIFANFISGLIVLFERPCRVGDIITIGTVEGTVARIRTRATTIVDWDNKEVIVPNKSFITDRLVNWTLSDSITRVVVKVGIAYRNDPKLAQKLLLEVANAHELVLKDPPPSAWMMGFGNSTLDFELRFYVAEINQRNLVRTELQVRINQVFRDNDIEIAYSQTDVWFRNALDMNAPPQPTSPAVETAAPAPAPAK